MSIRQQKGLQIAQRANIIRQGRIYLVPSQSGKGKKYKVDAEKRQCTCPDFDFRREPCKHLYAVEVVIERQKTTTTQTDAEGNKTTTTTETVTIKRKTYRQEWPAYNKAQTQEKRIFQYLLHQLCQGVGEPAQYNGRPRLPLEDMIFAMAFKVYSTVSGRRFATDLKDAHGKGYLSALPSYNTVFRYFESEMLTPYLQMLIEESALPLASIEQDFAIDSSGLSTGVYIRWNDAKWGNKTRDLFGGEKGYRVGAKDWIKIHITTGVKTNVVTAVEVTDAHAGDSPYFKPLIEATAQNFAMRQVSADGAYLSGNNLKTVVENHAMPYIPFRANSTGKHGSDLFKRMFHFYSYNSEQFMQNYHKRSNVESTFHMIKAKFGDKLRSRTRTAQVNEALCKVLCHNIVVLIQSMFELGLKPKFWSVAA